MVYYYLDYTGLSMKMLKAFTNDKFSRVSSFTPGWRETSVNKVPCLGAYTPSVIRTRDPLIKRRWSEPIRYSAFTVLKLESCTNPLETLMTKLHELTLTVAQMASTSSTRKVKRDLPSSAN